MLGIVRVVTLLAFGSALFFSTCTTAMAETGRPTPRCTGDRPAPITVTRGYILPNPRFPDANTPLMPVAVTIDSQGAVSEAAVGGGFTGTAYAAAARDAALHSTFIPRTVDCVPVTTMTTIVLRVAPAGPFSPYETSVLAAPVSTPALPKPTMIPAKGWSASPPLRGSDVHIKDFGSFMNGQNIINFRAVILPKSFDDYMQDERQEAAFIRARVVADAPMTVCHGTQTATEFGYLRAGKIATFWLLVHVVEQNVDYQVTAVLRSPSDVQNAVPVMLESFCVPHLREPAIAPAPPRERVLNLSPPTITPAAGWTLHSEIGLNNTASYHYGLYTSSRRFIELTASSDHSFYARERAARSGKNGAGGRVLRNAVVTVCRGTATAMWFEYERGDGDAERRYVYLDVVRDPMIFTAQYIGPAHADLPTADSTMMNSFCPPAAVGAPH